MAYRRVYGDKMKEYAKKAGIVSIPLVFVIFMYLFAVGDINITGHSGDVQCAGTVDNPCMAYVNFTTLKDVYIYPMNRSDLIWVFGTDKPLKDLVIQRRWGNSWRTIDLTKTYSVKVKYALKLSAFQSYEFRFIGYKNNPSDDIKWSLGYLDPMWFGVKEKNGLSISEFKRLEFYSLSYEEPYKLSVLDSKYDFDTGKGWVKFNFNVNCQNTTNLNNIKFNVSDFVSNLNVVSVEYGNTNVSVSSRGKDRVYNINKKLISCGLNKNITLYFSNDVKKNIKFEAKIGTASTGIGIKDGTYVDITTDSGMTYVLESLSCSFSSISNSKDGTNANVVGASNGVFIEFMKTPLGFGFELGDAVDYCHFILNSTQLVIIQGEELGVTRKYHIYNNQPWLQVFSNASGTTTDRSPFDYWFQSACNQTYGDGSAIGIEQDGTDWNAVTLKEGWLSNQKDATADTDAAYLVFDELENAGDAAKVMLENDEAAVCRMQRHSTAVNTNFLISNSENTTYRSGIMIYDRQRIRINWNSTYFKNSTAVNAMPGSSEAHEQADFINITGNNTHAGAIITGNPNLDAMTIVLGNFNGATNLYFYNRNDSSAITSANLIHHWTYNNTDWVYGSDETIQSVGALIDNETSICGSTHSCLYGNMKSNTNTYVIIPMDYFNVTTTKQVLVATSKITSGGGGDTTKPLWGNISESLSDPQTYSYNNINAGFQVNCTDETGIKNAFFTHNLTGSWANITMSNNTASIFYANITRMGASVLNYSFVCNDTSGNQNRSTYATFTVNKATPTVTGVFGGSSTITYGTSPEYVASEFNSGDVGCTYEALRNGISLGTGSPIEDTTILSAGIYNYTYYTNGCTNYTYNKDEDILTVNKVTTTCNLYLNNTEGNRTYEKYNVANFTVKSSYGMVNLSSNYTGWVSQTGSSPLSNISTLLNLGTNFNMTGYYEGDANHTSCSKTYYFNVQNAPTTLYFNNSATNQSFEMGDIVNITCNSSNPTDALTININTTGLQDVVSGTGSVSYYFKTISQQSFDSNRKNVFTTDALSSWIIPLREDVDLIDGSFNISGLSSSENVTIDIGKDGIIDRNFTGTLNGQYIQQKTMIDSRDNRVLYSIDFNFSVFSSVSSGYSHNCLLLTNSSAYCWGNNDYGQLGDGTYVDKYTPTPVGIQYGNYYFKQINSDGYYHTCGILTNGSALCWGQNDYGQVGDGTTTERTSPRPVSGGFLFSSINTGLKHTCGILTNGSALCWGKGANGELGDGLSTQHTTPYPVSGGYNFISISAGYLFTCGVLVNNSALCWGENGVGQLGDGTTTDRTIPRPVSGGFLFSNLTNHDLHTCGVLANNSLLCWGNNGYGRLGDGTTTQRTSPYPVTGGYTFRNESGVSAGATYTCGILTNGSALCWGRNKYGQLGDGTTTDRTSGPYPVVGNNNFTSIGTGGYNSCGILTNTTILCWGRNDYGQVGDETIVMRLFPKQTSKSILQYGSTKLIYLNLPSDTNMTNVTFNMTATSGIFVNPYVNVGGDDDIEWDFTGNFTGPNVTTNLTQEVNDYLFSSDCSGILCNVPLYIYLSNLGEAFGNMVINETNVTYNPNPVKMNLTAIRWGLDNNKTFFQLQAGVDSGEIQIDNLNVSYNGTSDYIVTCNTTKLNLTVFYSKYTLARPYTFTNKTIFLPSLNNSTQVTPYGQTDTKPIFNVSWNTYDHNSSLGIRVNQTIPCANFSVSTTSDYNKTGLVGYWHFDEGSGNVNTKDSSGNNNTGILTNMNTTGNSTSGWTTGYFGNGLLFDGVNDYVRLTPSNILISDYKLTGCLWYYANGAPNEKDGLLVGQAYRFHFWIDPTGSIYYGAWTNVANYEVKSTLTFGFNKWVFVCNVLNGTDSLLYVNGTFIENKSYSGNIVSPTYFDVGRHAGTNLDWFNGTIDEVMVWNRALSSDEISQLYNSTFASNRFNLTTSFQEIYYNRQMNSTNTTNIWMWMDLNNCPSGTIYSREFELKSCCMNCSCW